MAVGISSPTLIDNKNDDKSLISGKVDGRRSAGVQKSELIKQIISKRGVFEGILEWCSDISLNDWRAHLLQINNQGKLCQAPSTRDVQDMQETLQTTMNNSGTILKHLQGCELQLMADEGGGSSTLRVSTKQATIYLRSKDRSIFISLLASLIFWQSLKPAGIFNKICVFQTIFPSQEKPIDMLVCQLNVYGPIPRNRNVNILDLKQEPPHDVKLDEKTTEGWFSAMGTLKSNGRLDLISQIDGSLLYSLAMPQLLRSEIQIVNSSIFKNENTLYVGFIPELRRRLKVSRKTSLIRSSAGESCDRIYLQFPLRIDLEDWLVALQSFSRAEMASLFGSDKSNELRISNRFKLSILEADFGGINLFEEQGRGRPDNSALYVKVLIWGITWAKTSLVSGTNTPFWREEFDFNFSVGVPDLCIRVMQKVPSSKTTQILGEIHVTQGMLNDMSLGAETRFPVFHFEHENFQLGTICIKATSSLNTVLPSINFSKFETMLLSADLSKVREYVYDRSLSEYLKLEDLSVVLLDIFQAIGRIDEWLQALSAKEIAEADGSILRNNNKKLPSTHIFNSLFRGNSILTKSIEKYFYRVGSEYLERTLGGILRRIVDEDVFYELDPSRIEETDEFVKVQIIKSNATELMALAEKIWKSICSTSNDLPPEIKLHLKIIRKNLEIICHTTDVRSTLNCISGFLFLRFFCPVILNPKLFDLVEDHPNARPRRTLILLSKMLLNLSTITFFGKKEPYMEDMNDFIRKHEAEFLDYIDKVTEKKLDFTPKLLKLSSTVSRPELLMNKKILKELPTNPFLIDKYLRETELISVLAHSRMRKDDILASKKQLSIIPVCNTSQGQYSPQLKVNIGELEFEKMTENNAEIFGDDLMKYLGTPDNLESELNMETQTKYESHMEQIEQESCLLYNKLEHLTNVLSGYEFPNDIILGKAEFATYLVESLYLDEKKNIINDINGTMAKEGGLKKFFSDTANNLPLISSPRTTNQGFSQSDVIHETRATAFTEVRKSEGSKNGRFTSFVKRAGTVSSNSDKGSSKLLRIFRKRA
ncbi:LAMI_0G03994g1_1 [Lachancea mirantina]|uniref:LAMI_0G03994g1_1 n=1 Tax=Lachancea mirantina TaxID=1230905 RepID=A0A1G4K8C9_9SACH|nr:LAMI_0G03994g1_1 [Lachancea mirantina]